MQLYKYNRTTGEYIGTITAQKRPNGDAITDVLGATTVAPPEAQGICAAVWTQGAWVLKEDHRQKYDASGVKVGGTPYWLPDDTHETPARYMATLGPLPDGALLELPAKPAPTTDELAAKLRDSRDRRITACDWIMARHAEELAMEIGTTLTDSQYSGWLFYRQELRDLTDDVGFPWDGGGELTPWPVMPTEVE